MKTLSVFLPLGLVPLLFGLCVSEVRLNVSPDRELYFNRDSVSLSCDDDDGQTVDGWMVKRTAGGLTQTCDEAQQGFGISNGSSCFVPRLLPSDSGGYWCETSAGRRSVQVNISVSDRSVILEFPKLPVFAGSDVTLRCKTRYDSTRIGYFFRNYSFIGTGLTGEFTISQVQHSHEGLYWCLTGLFSISSKTWLSVIDPPPPPPSPPWQPVVRLVCQLVVVCLYFISTVLMVSVYCNKKTGNRSAVSVEMDTHAEGGWQLAEDYADITDYVATEHDF